MKRKLSFVGRLNKPYYLETLPRRRWLNGLVFATFVFLFLFAARPFGLEDLPQGILSISLGYALISFVIMVLLNIAFMPLLPKFFSEEKWNVQRELYWNMASISIIGFGIFLYSVFIGMATFSPYAILIFELYVISIAVIPVTVVVLAKESWLNDWFGRQAAELNAQIEEYTRKTNAGTPAQSILKIFSENEKDSVELAINNLVYIQAIRDHVEMIVTDNNTSARKQLRNSLKAVTKQVENYSDLFRCHKKYLININHIKHISGNAQGFKLKLEASDKSIPVSRQSNNTLKMKLNR